jgi:hypothetical protein
MVASALVEQVVVAALILVTMAVAVELVEMVVNRY